MVREDRDCPRGLEQGVRVLVRILLLQKGKHGLGSQNPNNAVIQVE